MLVKVVSIVGNGLDISLGLDTRYSDFYQHIATTKPNSKNKIYQAIKEDPGSWSDFEAALGVHTSQIDMLPYQDQEGASNAFHVAFDEVLSDIGLYLDQEETKMSNVAFNYSMKSSDFYSGLLGSSLAIVEKVVNGNPIQLDFVTLNYTNSLERLFENKSHILQNRGMRLGLIHHAHGSLTDYTVMGVSNESQVSTALTGDNKSNLIKPLLLESMDDGILNATKSTIEGADIIVVYGASIGATDDYIWEMVSNWLAADESRFVVLHDFDPEFLTAPSRNPIRIKQLDAEARARLLAHTDKFGGMQKAELNKRIFIVRNTKKLFQFDY